MLEIVELIRPVDQGRMTPFLCNASDGQAYYVILKFATVQKINVQLKLSLLISLGRTHLISTPLAAFLVHHRFIHYLSD